MQHLKDFAFLMLSEKNPTLKLFFKREDTTIIFPENV